MGIGEATPSVSMPQISIDELHLLRGVLAFPTESSLELVRQVSDVWPWLAEGRKAIEAAPMEAWREEYRRLFLSGGPQPLCPPYASAYDRVSADAPWRVTQLYLEVGVPPCNMPPDYLGAELNLLAELFECEHDLGTAPLKELWDHMALWVPQFAACLRGHSQSAFYHAVADRLDALFA